MSDCPQRRKDDERVHLLVQDVSELKRQMLVNTAITEEVRDILASFKNVAAVAKWLSAIVGGLAAGFALVKGWKP